MENRARERQTKTESRRRASEAQREKGRQRSRARDKQQRRHFFCYKSNMTIGGFHVTSSPPCWWTVNKRSLISSLCLSTSICSFHHCYLCLPRLHENHLFCSCGEKIRNASGHQCKVKMSGSEKKSEREHVRHFLHKTCN